ncbi:hypothetical protein [Corynebacterium pacaense]|uniref:hypothetical protein n=1 Tax=Corynebacterium pacaense TaxID=1816684 RepID=UPI0009BC1348|nr:hypothetical protein [Corynebacterium pacaense]
MVSPGSTTPFESERAPLLAWARGISGPVPDVGCGPGQWTDFLGGVPAPFSHIHTGPELIGEPLAECARAIGDGGSLFLGFFAGTAG